MNIFIQQIYDKNAYGTKHAKTLHATAEQEVSLCDHYTVNMDVYISQVNSDELIRDVLITRSAVFAGRPDSFRYVGLLLGRPSTASGN